MATATDSDRQRHCLEHTADDKKDAAQISNKQDYPATPLTSLRVDFIGSLRQDPGKSWQILEKLSKKKP